MIRTLLVSLLAVVGFRPMMQTPLWSWQDDRCPYTPSDATIHCGTLTVPLDYQHPDGEKAQLAVMILPALSEALPDPVIYLDGGPGGSGLLSLDTWLDHPLRAQRDFILLDGRGTGFSTPNLNCPEVEDQEDFRKISPYTDCYYRLATIQGLDLNLYNSAANAADIDALRQALGAEQVNLYGISYGTRWALTVIREYPNMVRAVVLDGVFPPERDLIAERIANRLGGYRTLFSACAADAECRNAYPTLEDDFYGLVAQYNDAPYVFATPDEFGGIVPNVIFGDTLAEAVFLGLYRTQAIPVLPAGIDAMQKATTEEEMRRAYLLMGGYIVPEMLEGNWEPRDTIFDLPEVQRAFDLLGDITLSEGVNVSVDCIEEFPFSDPDAAVAADYDFTPPPLQDYIRRAIRGSMERCSIWNVTRADVRETWSVVSDVPTLLLSGVFDPITPIGWAISAQQGLVNSRHIVVPVGGHGASSVDPCVMALVTAHITAPHLRPPVDCLTEGIDFYVD